MRRFIFFTLATLALFAASCNRQANEEEQQAEVEEPQHTILYGIIADNYRTEQGEIGQGETLGKILARYGVSATTVDKLDKAAKDIFPLRQIRAGRPFTAFIAADSTGNGPLDYFVYEKDVIE